MTKVKSRTRKPSKDTLANNAMFGWLGIATAIILLVPLIAMQFTNDVNWNLSDFVIMGILVFGFGSMFILIARKVDRDSRLLLGLAILAAFMYVWAELAVGIFFNLGN